MTGGSAAGLAVMEAEHVRVPATEGRGDRAGQAASPTVGLVTIWYRAASQMDRFFADLAALRYPAVQPIFVIHDQRPEEVERLRRAVPGAWIIDPGANLGCAAGWNLAFRRLLDAGIPYIGIWNADVRLDPACVERLIAVMEEDRRVGACQPLLLYSDAPGTVEMYGGAFDPGRGLAAHASKGVADLAALPPLRDADYLDGGTLFVRADVLRAVGLFDERLHMYAEDCDLCYRIRKAGFRTVAVRDARAWHYHREQKGRFPPPHELFYLTRNRGYLAAKHVGEHARWRLLAAALPGLPRRLAYYLRHRQPRLARVYLAGLACAALGRMGERRCW